MFVFPNTYTLNNPSGFIVLYGVNLIKKWDSLLIFFLQKKYKKNRYNFFSVYVDLKLIKFNVNLNFQKKIKTTAPRPKRNKNTRYLSLNHFNHLNKKFNSIVNRNNILLAIIHIYFIFLQLKLN